MIRAKSGFRLLLGQTLHEFKRRFLGEPLFGNVSGLDHVIDARGEKKFVAAR